MTSNYKIERPSKPFHVANPLDKGLCSQAYVVSFNMSHPIIVYANDHGGAVDEAAEYAASKGWDGCIVPHSMIEPCCDFCTLLDDGCDCMSYTESGYYEPAYLSIREFPCYAGVAEFKRYCVTLAGGTKFGTWGAC